MKNGVVRLCTGLISHTAKVCPVFLFITQYHLLLLGKLLKSRVQPLILAASESVKPSMALHDDVFDDHLELALLYSNDFTPLLKRFYLLNGFFMYEV